MTGTETPTTVEVDAATGQRLCTETRTVANTTFVCDLPTHDNGRHTFIAAADPVAKKREARRV